MCLGVETHGCIVRCAWWNCNRPFAVCEHCKGGQKYCSDQCKRDAREEQVRRARLKHARSEKGKRATSKRNLRYRVGHSSRMLRAKSSQKIETDHPSTQDLSRATDGPDVKRATEGSPVGVAEDPCYDEVDSQECELGGVALGQRADEIRKPLDRQTLSLEVCRFCGARIRLFVDSDTLRARIAARRAPGTPRRGRRPRLPVGPG